jgi:hypothetical protein
MAMKAEQLIDDTLDLEDHGEAPPDIEKLRAVIAESDAYFAAGGEGIPLDAALAKMRRTLQGA